MRTRTLIGAGLALALAAGVGAYSYNAVAQGGPGYGPGWMMGGGGPGWMMNGGGRDGGWNCPAFGQSGGPGGQQQGYGPGYHMRGWGGGPGMMRGYGRGYGPRYAQGDQSASQDLKLTVDDVKTKVEGWLNARGNPRLQIGEVKEKDADTITADIVTKDKSLVEQFIINRHTGEFSRDNG